jgi:hypothetical protein
MGIGAKIFYPGRTEIAPEFGELPLSAIAWFSAFCFRFGQGSNQVYPAQHWMLKSDLFIYLYVYIYITFSKHNFINKHFKYSAQQ